MSMKKLHILGSLSTAAPNVRVAEIELSADKWAVEESHYAHVISINYIIRTTFTEVVV